MNELGTAQTRTDFCAEYRSQADGDLLQLWVERSDLVPEAEAALKAEITRRGLTEEAATAKDIRVEDDDNGSERDKESDNRLAPAVAAWGPSIAWFWLREMCLRRRTKYGIPFQAKVESTLLTRPAGRDGSRAELRYSYECQGQRTGRTVRDFTIGNHVGKALAFGHKSGDTITVLVDPNDPDCSYFPSGFGWIQPLLYGVFFSILGMFFLACAFALAVIAITNH